MQLIYKGPEQLAGSIVFYVWRNLLFLLLISVGRDVGRDVGHDLRCCFGFGVVVLMLLS